MEEKEKDPDTEKKKFERGLYKGVSISVKTLDKFIIIGIIAVVILIGYGVNSGSSLHVTYESKGGTDVAYQEYRYEEDLKLPEGPTREGYKFAGWYFDENCTQPAEDGMHVESDLTLYAKWEKE